MDEDKALQLVEMGFTYEQATSALTSANNNLETALGILVSDPVDEDEVREVPAPASKPQTANSEFSFEDTVEIRNVEDLPDFESIMARSADTQRGSSEHNQYEYDIEQSPSYGDFETNTYGEDSNEDAYSADNYRAPPSEQENYSEFESIYHQLHAFTRSEYTPPAILSRNASYIENNVIPFLIIASQLDAFKELVYSGYSEGSTGGPKKSQETSEDSNDPEPATKSDTDQESEKENAKAAPVTQDLFLDYGYDANWYNNESKLNVAVPDSIADKASSYKFLIELQRTVAFLDTYSNRSFMSGTNLLRNLPKDFKSDLANRIEDIEDFVRKLYQSLNYNLCEIFGTLYGIDVLFKSHVESVSDEAMDSIYVLPIDSESRGSNIYECLNNMFWNDKPNIGNVRFVEVAPVLTIQICGDDSFSQGGVFNLDETFYPQIYSAEYSEVIVEMYEKEKSLNTHRSSLSRSIMEYNSFEGKKIKQILQSSANYFEKLGDDETPKDLRNVTEQIKVKTDDITTKLNEASKEYASLDITNHRNILEQISTAFTHLDPVKPYTLVGVILSDSEYFYRSKKFTNKDEEWVYYRGLHNRSGDKKIVDYQMEAMNFTGVKTFIAENFRLSTESLVIVYTTEELFNAKKDVEVPVALRKFFEKDNEELDELLQKRSESSGDESNNIDEEDTPDEIEVDKKEDKKGDDMLVDL